MLALKGGTPINMIIFNMPRLSVDIDLDFSLNATREEMLRKRNNINDTKSKFLNIGWLSLYTSKNFSTVISR